ncbi:hypothetical protein O6H91_01G150300 [Diphasiastrum complanatum]|uniref:Uncharacterized protein n=1 Tax=Diphasiastrum complanatum TaxID=34168 RepID=A0ACC2EXR2_DIPCM|nr:hypothetical protein O6H91_01G150300 [Diphasiastrum complanatum]
MEELEHCSRIVSAFCKQLQEFCSHLHTSCTDLRTMVMQVPAPLADDATSLLGDLNVRISQTNTEVEALKGLTLGKISFEELVGHCMELYKENEVAINQLESHLTPFGYVSGPNTKEACCIQDAPVCTLVDKNSLLHVDEPVNFQKISHLWIVDSLKTKVKCSEMAGAPLVATAAAMSSTPLPYSFIKQRDDPVIDPLDSSCLSINDFGLSAASLAALSREEASPNEINFTEKSESEYCAEDVRAAIDLMMPKREEISEKFQAVITCNKKSSEEMQVTPPASHVKQIKQCSPNKEYFEEKFGPALIAEVSIDDFNKCPTWLRWQVSLQVWKKVVYLYHE